MSIRNTASVAAFTNASAVAANAVAMSRRFMDGSSLRPVRLGLPHTRLSRRRSRGSLIPDRSRHHRTRPAGDRPMSDGVTPEMKQNRMKEFMSLLPLTLELAGLPKSEPGRLFSADQIEARLMSVRTAYKLARNFLKDIG